MDVLYLYLVLLCILGCCVLSSGWGVSSTGGVACLSHFWYFNTVTGWLCKCLL